MFPGLIGIPFMQNAFPHTRISASAGPVKSVSSGVLPASDIPGIVDVKVLETVHVNVPFLPHILDRIPLAVSLLPYIPRDDGISNFFRTGFNVCFL